MHRAVALFSSLSKSKVFYYSSIRNSNTISEVTPIAQSYNKSFASITGFGNLKYSTQVRAYRGNSHSPPAPAFSEAYHDNRSVKSRSDDIGNLNSSTLLQTHGENNGMPQALTSTEARYGERYVKSKSDDLGARSYKIGKNIPRKDKVMFLVKTLMELKDTKEAVYSSLDAWVAWEQDFPIVPLKRALLTLQQKQQWHRIIQVIKWMFSKGQGNTMGMYEQLIRALDMDNRAEEAHKFWVKKIGHDLHSVPWQLCNLVISMYYRNEMFENLIKLFKGLEAYDRKPQAKLTVQKVANAYRMLGLLDEEKRVLERYNYLFVDTWQGRSKNAKKASKIKADKSGGKDHKSIGDTKRRSSS